MCPTAELQECRTMAPDFGEPLKRRLGERRPSGILAHVLFIAYIFFSPSAHCAMYISSLFANTRRIFCFTFLTSSDYFLDDGEARLSECKEKIDATKGLLGELRVLFAEPPNEAHTYFYNLVDFFSKLKTAIEREKRMVLQVLQLCDMID